MIFQILRMAAQADRNSRNSQPRHTYSSQGEALLYALMCAAIIVILVTLANHHVI